MKIVYVILHYNAYGVTVSCVESIEKIHKDADIVIVDNHSLNNSGNDLKVFFHKKNNIHIILNNENLGFAKGNNIGYCYAKNILRADIIVDINNDVTISQIDFEQRIKAVVLKDESIAVIAPRIINKAGKNQNPYRLHPISNLKRIRYLLTYTLYYLGLKSYIFWKFSYKLLTRNRNVVGKIYDEPIYNIVPHGSCLIFTPSFVRESEYAFVPVTFFYGEEDILYDYVEFLNLRTYYLPDIMINHWEKVSTNTLTVDTRKRTLFQTKNRIYSLYAGIKFSLCKEKINIEVND